ncbi:unnamed protein product [Mytilus coruscus]|uniref:Uncharacterized protein n=1 Tax=Mytilus coruscus TaxID=42192 RepID=A0A6J8EHY7_MYTCO|nr:unnamed protein product [Mytilus coruscus]
MNEESKKNLTINTHRGLYQYNRMLFGVRTCNLAREPLTKILQGLTGVQCILDDMVITGKNDREHLVNLDKVIKRLEMYNLSDNKDKCKFSKDEIEFCGHKIDKHGLHKTEDKIKAILDTPEPQNVTQTVIDVKWDWNEECKVSFKRAKDLVTSEQVLCHYDPELPIRLACDASPFGLRAVLSHKMQDGTERPIAFASRLLNKAERNYSQIDKEALGIIFGVKKFHTYLYGRKFTLITDHMPLVSIFNPKKGISTTSAARLQRYALFLSGYTYDIEYKNTNKHTNADALSRIPQESTESDGEEFDAVDVFMLKQLEHLSLTNNNIRRETARDKILSRVYEFVQKGWTVNDDIDLKPYFNRKNELSISQGCFFFNTYYCSDKNLDSKL